MEKIVNYVSFAITIATTAYAIYLYIKSKISSKANATNQEELAKYKSFVELAKIVQKIPELVSRAERLFPSTDDTKYGPAKLEYVLKELQILCISNSVEYQEAALKYEIEKVLSTPQRKEES